ncbi:CPBP family intramembrane glutamic endopeptidase [Dyella thiooxydans]|uniref:CPBP family intramembrane glutamic endopeptidase n=1 Tax=Dyella thiooxydans TaxID=445710 RepID=UPI0007C47563|nr:CPBP family intramembrane glutamic endopeptidase [Dyella thiooxydans]
MIALLLAFGLLAAELTAIHLANDAGRVLQTLQRGEPRWQWRPRVPRDLIAGRIFGDGDARRTSDGLEIISRGKDPFELGLPIAQRLDLAHWPVLAVDSEGSATARVSIVWGDGHGTACLTPAQAWQIGAPLRIDLRRQTGRDPAGRPCPLPLSASMLRLRVDAPPGTSWILRHVALEAADPATDEWTPPAFPSPSLPSPTAQLAALTGQTASPLIWLPVNASAEELLTWRDEAVRRQAGAIVVRADLPPRTPRPGLPGWLTWLACGTYAAALLHLAWRPRGDLIALAAALAGPLWLLAGLQWGGRASWPAAAAFASALAFAAWSTRDKGLRQWCWLGRWKSAMWWAPLLLVPVAVAVGQLWGHPMEPVKPGRAVIYLGWAGMQQWLLLGFALPRLERILRSGPWAVLVVAALFALMHTPNGMLMQLCLLSELFWAACFLRNRSLLPVAIAHAASALIVGAMLVGPMLRSLEVSARFFS